MPIKNYTTTIDASKTIVEIQKILSGHGANRIGVDYEAGEPSSVYFEISISGDPVSYRLPCDWRGVLAVLDADGVQPRYLTEEHARRVSWRIVKDWIDAQLALIESGQARLAQVMLPYAVSPDGRTLYELVEDYGATRLLAAATE